MRSLLVLVLIAISIPSFPQLYGYQPLESKGEIPESFRSSASDFNQENIEEQEFDRKRRKRKLQESYILNTAYTKSNLLKNGRIVYGTEINEYLNRVLSKIIEVNQWGIKRDDLELYLIKTSATNAFAMDDGTMFVTLGLLSRLENEAQLAFILCHEIAHHYKKHGIEIFVEQEEIEKNFRRSYEKSEFAKHNFSREKESEADSLGYLLFKRTGYQMNIDSVFDILAFSFTNFNNDIPLNREDFEFYDYPLDSQYWVDTFSFPELDFNYNDSLSTHPNPYKRKVNLKEWRKKDNSGEEFLIGKEAFEKVKKMAQFECARIYYLEKAYTDAIYASMTLKKQYDEHLDYLNSIILYSFYNLARINNKWSSDSLSVLGHPAYYLGNEQTFYNLLLNCSVLELSAISTQYAWDGPVSSDQKEYIIQDLLNGLEDLDYDFDDIRKQVDSSLVEKIEALEEEGEKVENELSDEELMNAEKQVSFSRNIYSNLLKQPKFRSLARKVMTSSREIEPRNKIKNRSRKSENHYGYAYGIKKVVLVSPLYWKFDARYDIKLERLKSDEKSKEISTIISNMSNKLNLDLEVLDPKKFRSQDVEKFNLYTELVEWQTDYFNNDEDYAIMMTQPYGEKFSEIYDTEIFIWVFIENIKVRNQTSLGSMLYFFSVVGVPFVLYDMFAPDFRTNIYLYAMNIETGQKVHKQIVNTRTLDRTDILNGNIYQLLYELNRRR